jgi:hypothetical protein
MKTRGNPSGPEVVKNLNIRPDIWMQLRLLIVVIEEKKLAKKRSPYMSCLFSQPNTLNPIQQTAPGETRGGFFMRAHLRWRENDMPAEAACLWERRPRRD